MKHCPTCNQTFEEEWLSFCTQDGTTLIDDAVGSNEPAPTIMVPAPPDAPAWNTPSADVPPSSPEWRPPPPPTHVQPQSKNLATASMILGIVSVTVGWLCFGPIPGIASIILGVVALSQIKKTPDLVTGKQMAWTGIITGAVTVLLYIGIMIFYVFVIVATNV